MYSNQASSSFLVMFWGEGVVVFFLLQLTAAVRSGQSGASNGTMVAYHSLVLGVYGSLHEKLSLSSTETWTALYLSD